MIDLLDHDRLAVGATALVDAATGETWGYGRLAETIQRVSESMSGTKCLAMVLVRRDVPSLIGYLAALRAGHAVLPMEADLDLSLLEGLFRRYRPELIIATGSSPVPRLRKVLADYRVNESSDEGITLVRRLSQDGEPIHPTLSLLLSTSGSTGSPKLVRLSAQNVVANAEAIRAVLGIDARERAITSLPFSYSFGLSVVHSHLLAGATLVVSRGSLVTPEFWEHVSTHGVTSFSGVPYTYEILRRIGFAQMELPSLHTMTQAGGKLGVEMIRYYHDLMVERGGVFVPMYGQTEATARIAILPPAYLPEKLGSVGFPLPGGVVRIRRVDGTGQAGAGEDGELVYEGPNVMMGYAETRADLGKGDELHGVLHTGDIGHFDADGVLYITGRLKRFAKLQGLRINLDEVEGHLHGAGTIAALDGGDRVLVVCTPGSENDVEVAIRGLARQMQVNPRNFKLRVVPSFPLLTNGKIDYHSLGAMLAD